MDKISGFQPINWTNFGTNQVSSLSNINNISASLPVESDQNNSDEFSLKFDQNQKAANGIVGLLFDRYA